MSEVIVGEVLDWLAERGFADVQTVATTIETVRFARRRTFVHLAERSAIMDTDGTWNLTINSPMGKQQAIFDLKADGAQLVGTLSNPSDGSSVDIFDGMIDGESLTWKVTMSQYRMTLAFAVTIDGNTMSGKVKAGIFGGFDVRGTRA